MPDIFSKAKRSEVMSRIKGRGNKDTELALIAIFRRHGITGWRRHEKLFGKPDFVFRQERVAVFVDGCFWHACPQHKTQPKANKAFWARKLGANKARDRLVSNTLRAKGWRVLRIWEHALRGRHEALLLRRLTETRSRPAKSPRATKKTLLVTRP